MSDLRILWLPGKYRRLLLPVTPRLLVPLFLPSNAAGLSLVVPLLREEVLLALLVAGQRDGEAAVAGQDVVVVGLAVAVAVARARGVLRGRRVAAVPEPGVLSLQGTEKRNGMQGCGWMIW